MAAVVLSALLRRQGPEVRAQVGVLVEAGEWPEGAVAELVEAQAAIDEVAGAWLTWWASANGRGVAEVLPASEWISAREASRMLLISERRVRQLLDERKLVGERVGRVWRVLRASVESRRASARGAACPKRS